MVSRLVTFLLLSASARLFSTVRRIWGRSYFLLRILQNYHCFFTMGHHLQPNWIPPGLTCSPCSPQGSVLGSYLGSVHCLSFIALIIDWIEFLSVGSFNSCLSYLLDCLIHLDRNHFSFIHFAYHLAWFPLYSRCSINICWANFCWSINPKYLWIKIIPPFKLFKWKIKDSL